MANEPKAGVLVRGPGTSTSDSIPAALSDGEVVIPADDVRRFGAAQLMRMVKEMGSALPEPGVKDGVQHAATGGMIVDPYAPQQPNSVTRVGNSYSGGNVSGNIAVNGQPAGGTVSTVNSYKAPPAPAAPPVLGAPAAVTPMALKPVAPGASGTAPAAAVPGAAPAQVPGPVAAPAAPQAKIGSAPAQQFFASGPLAYAQGGLVDQEDLNRAAFGIYPRPSSQFSTNANDAALQRGVQATGPASFVPAKPLSQAAIAPATPTRFNATTDPRSTLYAGGPVAAPEAAAAPEATPSAPVAPAAGLGPLSARGGVTDLGGASAPAADRLAQLNRDIAFQKDKQTWRNPSDPTPGLAVIDNPGPVAAQSMFDGAALRTTLARGAPPGRNGAQVFAQQVEGASIPLVQRAQQEALHTKEQGANQRSMFDQQGLAARAQMQDLRQQEANSIDRAKLGVDVYKSDQAARVAGAKAGLTEDQAKSAGYAVRMENALKLIGGVGATNPGVTRPGLGTALVNLLPEALANKARPEDRQRVEAAQLDALDAALTLNTGAAYTKEQLQGLSRSYFAQPGDADKTVAEKQARLNSLIDTARLRAGPSGGTLADTAVQKATAANAGGAGVRSITRTGTLNGRKVVQYSDGSTDYVN